MAPRTQKSRPVAFLAVLVLLVAAYFSYNPEKLKEAQIDELAPVGSDAEVTDRKILPNATESTEPETTEAAGTEDPGLIENRPEVKARQAEQEKLIADFKNTIRADLELPRNMHFSVNDISDSFIVLTGRSSIDERQFSAIASTQRPGLESALNLLKENKDAFPILRKGDYDLKGVVQTYPAPEGSGMGEYSVLEAGKKDNRSLYVVYVERQDQGGSYLFLYEASTDRIMRNDLHHERMMNSFKAR